MAPYVEREWGREGDRADVADQASSPTPTACSAPGVVLNRDPGVHLREPEDDAARSRRRSTTCVECGFCEPVCPSRDLTTTPRQRIVLRREMARQPTGSPVQRGAARASTSTTRIETCAADGTCVLACPVGIDTGKLVKELRAGQHSARAERVALRARAALGRGRARSLAAGLRGRRSRPALGQAPSAAPAARARGALSYELVPEWPPKCRRRRRRAARRRAREGAAAVYLPACINRIFGRARDGSGRALEPARGAGRRSRRARGCRSGSRADVAGHCCAAPGARRAIARAHGGWPTTWSSALALERRRRAARRLRRQLLHARDRRGVGRAAQRGERASATPSSRSSTRSPGRTTGCCPARASSRKLGSVAVHPTCSSRHLGSTPAGGDRRARSPTRSSSRPTATCCGFAGDRGLLHPELPLAATADEAAELARPQLRRPPLLEPHLRDRPPAGHRPPYESFIFTLEQLTRG